MCSTELVSNILSPGEWDGKREEARQEKAKTKAAEEAVTRATAPTVPDDTEVQKDIKKRKAGVSTSRSSLLNRLKAGGRRSTLITGGALKPETTQRKTLLGQ